MSPGLCTPLGHPLPLPLFGKLLFHGQSLISSVLFPLGLRGFPSLGTTVLLQPGVTPTWALGRGQQAIPGRRRRGPPERAGAGVGWGGGARAAPPDPPPLPSKDIRRRQNCGQRGSHASSPHLRPQPGRDSILPREGNPAPLLVCAEANGAPTNEASPVAGGAWTADAR